MIVVLCVATVGSFLRRVTAGARYHRELTAELRQLRTRDDRAERVVVAYLEVAKDAKTNDADRVHLACIALHHWNLHDLPIGVLVPFIDAPHVREAIIVLRDTLGPAHNGGKVVRFVVDGDSLHSF